MPEGYRLRQTRNFRYMILLVEIFALYLLVYVKILSLYILGVCCIMILGGRAFLLPYTHIARGIKKLFNLNITQVNTDYNKHSTATGLSLGPAFGPDACRGSKENDIKSFFKLIKMQYLSMYICVCVHACVCMFVVCQHSNDWIEWIDWWQHNLRHNAGMWWTCRGSLLSCCTRRSSNSSLSSANKGAHTHTHTIASLLVEG